MKKEFVLAFAIMFFCISCHSSISEKLTIATAANMQFAMAELVEAFSEEKNMDCETVVSSSGKLTAQIRSGAPFDVFVSANRKYPDLLFEKGLTTASPKIYAYGKLVLWSAKGEAPSDISDLKKEDIRHIALANPKTAPYGEAAEEVLRRHGLFEELKNRLVYGESIAQVNQFVNSGAAQVGFTAKSVVLSPNLRGKGTWAAIDSEVHSPIEQGAVVLKKSAHLPEAESFVEFLFSKKGKAILEKYGYEVGPKKEASKVFKKSGLQNTDQPRTFTEKNFSEEKMNSIHQFEIEAIEGGTLDLSDFKGKKMLVVNVASECGYTPQYQQLQELYETFGNKLVIIGFPANNFGGQEPGTNNEIREFCSRRYGVTFPLTAKIDVKTHPIYQWLTQKAQNGVLDSEVKWNFQKYLLDENGQLLRSLPSSVSPLDDSILEWING